MRREAVLELLRQLEANKTTPEKVADRLASLPFEDLGFAKLDHHRSLRSGMPEVVFAAGKTPEQVAAIFVKLAASGVSVLATRASQEHFTAVQETVPTAQHHELARCITLAQNAPPVQGRVTVICAGTSDLPVAEEAAVTAEIFGAEVTRITDVGVAGLQRLLAQLDKLRVADVIVCCAGMEGALPSVVGGLVEAPVIAVPTSVGYGAAFEGVAALLGMLNACSPNITVVNIDNGFGAGYVATLIARGPRSSR
ncbi:nickel pincer cofactor biosynthesis protein LarB [Granulicella mallensis]|uniref:1-(5-phosphoribosyl)-5-amino-4-imidazole-carboxylate (AIR) carboxylase n=1 Tax=Granulicella mallensis (strain ATCC BAA-1857 / DSM 23137 / MP5ACTX8) TaxID=682795 RepID=G8NRX8_GRAMM|nr:nickel pincer cofactor biosynthesis protein LarB [Granulicella mallensis]AEU35091.1 1-(5-phosphoribosyl)-5-amino-4-imidazole-carboxylate (AIR) carboxylase [Granulicella mallensis MP5ACTX8]